MSFVPSEVELWGVYVPPILLAATFGLLAMWLTVYLLSRHRIFRWFVLPEVVMLAVAAIYTVILGTFVFPL